LPAKAATEAAGATFALCLTHICIAIVENCQKYLKLCLLINYLMLIAAMRILSALTVLQPNSYLHLLMSVVVVVGVIAVVIVICNLLRLSTLKLYAL